MKGTWLWPENDRRKALEKLKTPHVMRMLTALKAKEKEGLSNAELDSLLGTSSQWLIFWELRELMALGLVEFDVHPFGEPGKYRLTEKGLSTLQEFETHSSSK
jgi:DNA-binding HxlR family transcriptional regulator